MSAAKCYLRVVNWEVFQHYKQDRTPPWIKLHNTVLEDPVLAALPDAAKAHVFGIWILASRLKNKIPNDHGFIGNRINATARVDLKSLIYASFLEHHPECDCGASDVLAKCSLDKEREKEGEGDEKQQPVAPDGGPGPTTPHLVRTGQRKNATWLTPYGGAWTERWGPESEPPWGELGQHLKRPHAQLGPEETLSRWRRFLAATEKSQWARPARFAQGLGEWAADVRPPARVQAKPSLGEVALENARQVIEAHKAAELRRAK